MNCSYIHSVHGCSAKLAWSFCTEVFFTRNYRCEQRQQGAVSERSDNDPSNKPKSTIRDRIRNLGNIFSSRAANTGDESRINANEVVMQMNELRRQHSSANLRRPAETPSRLQAQLDRALAAFQPIPPGMSYSRL